MEQQLENEHEERINFMREKHELETKIINLQEVASRSADEEQLIKAKKDLKRTKALLKDAQSQIEKSKTETSNKVVLRQLKNQVGLGGHFFWVRRKHSWCQCESRQGGFSPNYHPITKSIFWCKNCFIP